MTKRAATLAFAILVVGCPKDPAPTTTTTTTPSSAKPPETQKQATPTAEPKSSASAEASAQTEGANAKGAPSLEAAGAMSAEDYCGAIMKLVPTKPPAADVEKCVAEEAARKKDYPDRFACQARCVTMTTKLETARNCHSMCGSPKVMCSGLFEAQKPTCEKRLGKFLAGKVEAKDYDCYAACISKAKTFVGIIDCLGDDCSL